MFFMNTCSNCRMQLDHGGLCETCQRDAFQRWQARKPRKSLRERVTNIFSRA